VSGLFIPGGPKRFAHQHRGLVDLIQRKGKSGLIFDPGTGKTATALDYTSLLALKLPSGEARVLVIAPISACDSWLDQAPTYVAEDVGIWGQQLGGSIEERAYDLAALGGIRPFEKTHTRLHGERRAERVITRRGGPGFVGGPGKQRGSGQLVMAVVNLDSFASRQPIKGRKSVLRVDLMIDAVRRFSPDFVIVDESHKIKGVSANVSRAASRLTAIAPRRAILTGTLMPHSPLDVFAQFRFLDPLAFGYQDATGRQHPATFGSFRNRFAVTGGYMGKEVVAFKNLDDMQDVLSQHVTVARKEDALDLPPSTPIEVPVHLDTRESTTYEQMRQQLAVQVSPSVVASVPNRLAMLMRLRQITSGLLVDDNGVRHEIGTSKIRVIHGLVEDTLAGEIRIVVFCHFRPEIAALSAALASPGTEVRTITGDTPVAQRLAIRREFGSSDPRRIVLVAQTSTMSLGVNELVTASHAIFGSLPNKRDDFVQAKDRLDRQGQTRPVTFWFCMAPGTVDEVIYRSHEERTNLETALLRHVQGGPVPTY
jgi:hypothetical protein